MPRSLPESSSAWTSPPVVQAARQGAHPQDQVVRSPISMVPTTWKCRTPKSSSDTPGVRRTRRSTTTTPGQVRPEGRLATPASRLDATARRHQTTGRRRNLEDDGKRAIKRGRALGNGVDASMSRCVPRTTPSPQMWYARHGIITPEMQYAWPARGAAMWSSCAPSWPPAALVMPATSTTPRPSR